MHLSFSLFNLNNRFIQVIPLWIPRLNQINLPISMPFFNQFFPFDCCQYIAMYFVPNQMPQIVLLRKSFNRAATVLINSLHQIARDANVKCAVWLVGDEVDEVHLQSQS